MYLLRHVEDTNTTDRERLLHSLLIGIVSNVPPSPDAPHVAYGQIAEVGDLVIGLTGKQIGHVVGLPKFGARDAYGWMIRPLGLDKVERWDDEHFTPIRGVRGEDMLRGAQYIFWRDILRRCDEIDLKNVTPPRSMRIAVARPLTVRFEGETAWVSFRLKFGETERGTIPIPWQRYEVDKLRETCITLLQGAQFK